jgi:hypothetical protein
MIAEGLSGSSSLQGPGELGAKVVRVIILAEYLLLKSPNSFGVMAEVSARDLISNLQRMSLIEPTDEASSTVPIFDIQVSDWFHRRAHGVSKRGGPMAQLNNKWRDGDVVWAAPTLPSYLDEFSGVVPLQVVLDSRVGLETAVFIIDRTPFANQIAQLKPFHLNLKTGLVPCPTGPVFFLLYWLRNPSGEGCFASFEQTINPHNSKHLQPIQDLARQSHWHVFVIGQGNEELNWYEFENRFELDKSLSQLAEVVSDYPCLDFHEAKMEFQARFTMDDLFNS